MSKRDKVIWIDRGWQPCKIGYVPSQEAWDKLMPKLGWSDEWPGNIKEHAAQVCWATNKSDVKCILITIHIDQSEYSRDDILGYILHECVHAWQEIVRHMGGEIPSNEVEAYSIQCIFDGILKAYKRCHEC